MEPYRESRASDWGVLFGYIALFVAACISLAELSPEIGIGWFLASLPAGVAGLACWMAREFVYRCPQCDACFQIGVFAQFTTINMGSQRKARCPRCGHRSWVTILRRAR